MHGIVPPCSKAGHEERVSKRRPTYRRRNGFWETSIRSNDMASPGATHGPAQFRSYLVEKIPTGNEVWTYARVSTERYTMRCACFAVRSKAGVTADGGAVHTRTIVSTPNQAFIKSLGNSEVSLHQLNLWRQTSASGLSATSPQLQFACCDEFRAGAEYVLTGPQSLSQLEQISTIGREIGRSLCIEEMSPDEARRDLATLMPAARRVGCCNRPFRTCYVYGRRNHGSSGTNVPRVGQRSRGGVC